MPIDPTGMPYRPCVGLMVLNRDGLVWIGERTGSPNQDAAARGKLGGWWQMPQGGIDEGEEPAAAATRELFEETGMRQARIIAESAHWHHYDLPKELLGRVWKGKFRGQRQKWFVLRFTGDDAEINISPVDHDAEFSRWRWAPVGEVIDAIVPFKRDVYVKVLAEFSKIAVPDQGA
jgi:putative (di)nucleoside polyphosphate hydrolase